MKDADARLQTEERVAAALTNFRATFFKLEPEKRAALCQLFFKRIAVRYVEPPATKDGLVLPDGTVTFPVNRTKWVEMKFDVRANVDYQEVFGADLGVRIDGGVASPGGFEPPSPP